MILPLMHKRMHKQKKKGGHTLYMKRGEIRYPGRCAFCGKEEPLASARIFNQYTHWVLSRIDFLLKIFQISAKFTVPCHFKCKVIYYLHFYALHLFAPVFIAAIFVHMPKQSALPPMDPLSAIFNQPSIFWVWVVSFITVYFWVIMFFVLLVAAFLFHGDYGQIEIYDNGDYYTIRIRSEIYYREFLEKNQTFAGKEPVQTSRSDLDKFGFTLAILFLIILFVFIGLGKIFEFI